MIRNSKDLTSFVRQRSLTAHVADMELMNEVQWQQVGQAFGFTNRELQICEHLFLGETRQQIADQLEIKPRTVRHYLENIHQKMNVKNRIGVVLRVISARDLLSDEEKEQAAST